MVRIEGLSLSYRTAGASVPAVEEVDAFIPEGSIAAIIGPSGCGKTSLVQAIAGLLKPVAGRIFVDGEVLSGVRARTAVIFQDYGLLPWKTVEANAELPLLIRGVGARERRLRVLPILEELGLASFARFHPARLSGGMRQRLAVARALASGPDLLLMDEPFSSLDALTRESMQETLLAVHRRHRTTILLVTHSIEEAAYLADRVFVMRERNPGRIAATLETGRRSGSGGADDEVDAAESPEGKTSADFRSQRRFLRICVELRSALCDTGFGGAL